jgi:hypothetical protein
MHSSMNIFDEGNLLLTKSASKRGSRCASRFVLAAIVARVYSVQRQI